MDKMQLLMYRLNELQYQAGRGELGYMLAWGLGVPLPLVLILYFMFGYHR